MNYQSLSSIESNPVKRISTGISELDFVFGSTNGFFGMPEGCLTFCPGKGGVGKTRMWLEACKRISHPMMGEKALIISGETPIDQLKEEKFNGFESENLYISPSEDLYEMVEIVKSLKPKFVLVDSLETIEQFTGSKKSSKLVASAFRDAARIADAHVIFIGHLGKDGTAKGGTTFPHMVDIVLSVDKTDCVEDGPDYCVRVSDKNRYGKTGIKVFFRHDEWGVYSTSVSRLFDKDYDVSNDNEVICQSLERELVPSEFVSYNINQYYYTIEKAELLAAAKLENESGVYELNRGPAYSKFMEFIYTVGSDWMRSSASGKYTPYTERGNASPTGHSRGSGVIPGGRGLHMGRKKNKKKGWFS